MCYLGTFQYPVMPVGGVRTRVRTNRAVGQMAKLIREDGRGHGQVRRPDGRTEQFARVPRWRIRYRFFYPDGSRVVRSKMTGRKPDATLLRGEASRLERLTRTATAAQQDLGHFLRVGLISQDDYVRLGGANLTLSWDEV